MRHETLEGNTFGLGVYHKADHGDYALTHNVPLS